MWNKLLISLLFLFSLALLSFSLLTYYLGEKMPNRYDVNDVVGQNFFTTELGSIRFQKKASNAAQDYAVFLHGFNGSLNNWNTIWSKVNDCGTLFRLDIPGFGQSAWQTDVYNLDTQSKRVVQFLDAFNITEATLVGTSMGGSLAVYLAANYPNRVKNLILIAPSGYPGSLKLNFAERLIYQGALKEVSKLIATSTWYKTLFPDSRILQAITVVQSYGEEWEEMLSRISQPVTLIWSESDQRVDFQYQRKIAAKLSNVTSVLASDTAGHDVINLHPEVVIDALCQQKVKP